MYLHHGYKIISENITFLTYNIYEIHRLNFAGAVLPHMYIQFGVRLPTSLLVTEVGLFVFTHAWHVFTKKSLTYSSMCPRKQIMNFVYFNLPRQIEEKPKNLSDKKCHSGGSIYLKNMTFPSPQGASAIPTSSTWGCWAGWLLAVPSNLRQSMIL